MNPGTQPDLRADLRERTDLLNKLKKHAVGLNTEYVLATGEKTRRIYLDSTASTLRLDVVHDAVLRYLPYYANTHSLLHFGAKLSTLEYRWAHEMVLDFVRADKERYTAFFVGSGATAGLNRVARTLREKRPEKHVVITTVMEHHSNDLPHRKHSKTVVHIPAAMAKSSLGKVDMARLKGALEEHSGNVNYVAITGVSNVTGIINPVHEIAKLAHAHGALLVVDAAQMAAHVPIRVSGNSDPAEDLDVVILSGHKIYAPGSPGVVVTRTDLFEGLEPQEVGGGMVDDVYLNRYTMSSKFPDREEAGTPNISGAIALAAALYAMDKVGMETIAADEDELIKYAFQQFETIDSLIIYGEHDPEACERAGAISFNLRGVEHGLTAAILNDYFNVSVRNECFCAHPYVREMITEVLAEEEDDMDEDELEALADMQRGMVRSSFGIYSTKEDVDALVTALKKISKDRATYAPLYDRLDNGDYKHKTFCFVPSDVYSVRGAVDSWFAR